MSAPDRAAVVSLAGRAAYKPDYRGLAAARLRAAREKLGLDVPGMAEYLTDMVDWDVEPGRIRSWDRGHGMPLADVLLVAEHVLGDDTPEPAGILADVPAAFTARALAGYWVTCYDFTHDGRTCWHADVARVAAGSDTHIRGVNHPPEPRTEGRASPFRNEIQAQLAGRHLAGHWRNTSDTRYFGSLQLAVLPGETIMEGFYSGVASDIAVSSGRWKWARLEAGAFTETALAALTLRDPAVLRGLVAERTQNDPPLTLADIGEEH